MRRLTLVGLAAVMLACSAPGAATPVANSTTKPAGSLAASFVTRLDVLYLEHTFVLAKETEAAALQLPDYVGYLQLLSVNRNDILTVLSEALGHTSASELSDALQAVDNDVVQYGVGVVAHDQPMSSKASNDLAQSAVPSLIQLDAELVGDEPAPLATQLTEWSRAATQMVDDATAQKYEFFYPDVRTMFALGHQWGLRTARILVARYPDKFPGSLGGPAMLRDTLSVILEDHAYVSSMATDAIVAGRTSERDAALPEVDTNLQALSTTMSMFDRATFYDVWAGRITATVAYATSGDTKSKTALTDGFVARFSALAHVDPAAVGDQVAAALRVIDDQRAKDYASLPGDDRAAATAMQPIADAIAGA